MQRVAIFGDGKSTAEVAKLLLDSDTSCYIVKILPTPPTADAQSAGFAAD